MQSSTSSSPDIACEPNSESTLPEMVNSDSISVPGLSVDGRIKIAIYPHQRQMNISKLARSHKIPDLHSAICRFIDSNGSNDGVARGSRWDYTADAVPISYQDVDVWQSFRLLQPAVNDFDEPDYVTVTAKSASKLAIDSSGRICKKQPARYTPVLVLVNPLASGIHRMSSIPKCCFPLLILVSRRLSSRGTATRLSASKELASM